MRKIEREMVQAIIERRNWRKANTEVRVLEQNGGKGALVLLHGNPIAQYDCDGKMAVRHAGWRTSTTKSRLNAFLRHLGRAGYGVHQCAYSWFLTDQEGERPLNNDGWYVVA